MLVPFFNSANAVCTDVIACDLFMSCSNTGDHSLINNSTAGHLMSDPSPSATQGSIFTSHAGLSSHIQPSCSS